MQRYDIINNHEQNNVSTGQRGGHCDDGYDQVVEESCIEGIKLEIAVADSRRGYSRGTQGINGAGEFFMLEIVITCCYYC